MWCKHKDPSPIPGTTKNKIKQKPKDLYHNNFCPYLCEKNEETLDLVSEDP